MLFQMARRRFRWRKRKPRTSGGYRIEKSSLLCPTCLMNLNAGGTAAKIRTDFTKGTSETILKCEYCATESAWALLAQPPILYAYKKPENRNFIRFRRSAFKNGSDRKAG